MEMEQAPEATAEASLIQRALTHPGQIGAVGWLVVCAILWTLSDGRVGWFVILFPSLVGATLPIGRWLRPTSWLNGLDDRLKAIPATTAGRRDRFDSFVKQPILSVVRFVFSTTKGVPDPHLRAGLRVAFGSYLVGALLVVLLVVGYVLVALVLAAIAIVVSVLMISLVLKYAFGTNGPETRIFADWFGNRVEKHFDEEGRLVGESRETTDFLGTPVKHHYDSEGAHVGESRQTTDFFGNPRVEHHDADGYYAGDSRPSEDLFGNPETEHYDKDGAHTGTSRRTTDILGDPVIKHDRD